MFKNITLSAEESLIQRARRRASEKAASWLRRRLLDRLAGRPGRTIKRGTRRGEIDCFLARRDAEFASHGNLAWHRSWGSGIRRHLKFCASLLVRNLQRRNRMERPPP